MQHITGFWITVNDHWNCGSYLLRLRVISLVSSISPTSRSLKAELLITVSALKRDAHPSVVPCSSKSSSKDLSSKSVVWKKNNK